MVDASRLVPVQTTKEARSKNMDRASLLDTGSIVHSLQAVKSAHPFLKKYGVFRDVSGKLYQEYPHTDTTQCSIRENCTIGKRTGFGLYHFITTMHKSKEIFPVLFCYLTNLFSVPPHAGAL